MDELLMMLTNRTVQAKTIRIKAVQLFTTPISLGIKHEFLLFTLRATDGFDLGPDMYLRVDRRRKEISTMKFVAAFGVTEANDKVVPLFTFTML